MTHNSRRANATHNSRRANGATLKAEHYEQTLLQGRLFQAFVVIVVLQLGLIARFAWLQIFAHQTFATQSEENRVRQNSIASPRGLIFDRNGVLLADNRPAFRLELIPEQSADLDRVWSELSQIVALSDEDRVDFDRQRSQHRKFHSVPIKLRLSESEVATLSVSLHRFPGLRITPYLTRFYPQGTLSSHVVGYVGRIDERDLSRFDATQSNEYAAYTHIGKIGIESRYEALLRGKPGYERVEVNAAGRTVRVLKRVAPLPGRNLYLSLDSELQAATTRAFGENSGAAVAIDPTNGQVLAMVSVPSFDANVYINGISKSNYEALMQDPARPTFHRALSGIYPPGSTFKPFMGMAGLELGLRQASSITVSRGIFYLPRAARGYRDWKAGGHGAVNLHEALAQSANTYFYQLALDLGIDRMHSYIGQFGFGRPTGVDLNGEASGLLPSKEWKRSVSKMPWFPGETVVCGIGQGQVSVTPLQLAHATGILAAGGVQRVPQLLLASQAQAQVLNGGARELHPVAATPSFIQSSANVETVRSGMIAVLHGPTGTARAVGRGAPFLIAGKTGTAQQVSAQAPRQANGQVDPRYKNQALFVAFAPAQQAKIAIGVVVERGGSGSAAAAVGRKILEAYLGTEPLPPVTPEPTDLASADALTEELPLESIEVDLPPAEPTAPVEQPPQAAEPAVTASPERAERP